MEKKCAGCQHREMFGSEDLEDQRRLSAFCLGSKTAAAVLFVVIILVKSYR